MASIQLSGPDSRSYARKKMSEKTRKGYLFPSSEESFFRELENDLKFFLRVVLIFMIDETKDETRLIQLFQLLFLFCD